MENLCLSLKIENLPNEEWKEITGFNCRYMVSNYSRVKSVLKSESIIKKHLIKGRFMVLLKKKGKFRLYTAYRLSAKEFITNENNYPDVLHKNKNQTEDVIDNLYWGKRERKGNTRAGENHGRAVITQVQVEEIREKHKRGYSVKELQFDYSVSSGCIYGALKKNWKAKSPD